MNIHSFVVSHKPDRAVIYFINIDVTKISVHAGCYIDKCLAVCLNKECAADPESGIISVYGKNIGVSVVSNLDLLTVNIFLNNE